MAHDGYQLWLRVDRATGPHVVALDPQAASALMDVMKAFYPDLAKDGTVQ